MSETRFYNTKRNIISGFVRQTISILLPFITRTVLLYSLGAQYQGLSGLFTSILQVLNLADLGFSTAVMYVLYDPIAKKEDGAICAILNYLRRVYHTIGTLIFLVGLGIMPFLRFFIAGDTPSDVNLYVLYVVYLFNSAVSYLLFSYKTVLVNAMQRADLVNNVITATNVAIRIIQIILLISVRSFYAYVFVIPAGTIINNIMVQMVSKKHFPAYYPKGKLVEETKKTISTQIRAIFIDRLGDVARNSFDNIVLSSLLGLTMVAVYDNYFYIFSALYGIMVVLRKSMQASVGNCIVTETPQTNYHHLLKFNFIFMWIVGFCCVSLFCLYQPFMMLWMHGDSSLVLSDYNMALFVLYFYLINMSHVRNLYLEGYGLFSKCTLWYVCEAVFNIVLNFALGFYLGVTGILLATIITIFVFNYLTRTIVLFKYYFGIKPFAFLLHHLMFFVITVIVAGISSFVCGFVVFGNEYINLGAKALIVLLLSNFMFFVFFFKTRLFKESKKVLLTFLKVKKIKTIN